MKKKGHFE